MRQNWCPPLAREVSVLGFGAASLGSRIARAEGLRALELAYDAGVTWFDTAPPYGDGESETLLGEFARGRRDRIVICSKVGIPRPTRSRLRSALKRIAQPIVKAAPGLRTGISALRPSTDRLAIDPKLIEQSVTDSLRALRTDYLDVLALHEPSPSEVADPEIQQTLALMVQKGFARTLSIAGDHVVALKAQTGPVPMAVQTPDSPFRPVPNVLRSDPSFLITHGVFGSGTLERLAQHLQHDPALRAQVEAAQLEASANALLLNYALASNAGGVVLTSMFTPDHIRANCARAGETVDPRVLAVLSTISETADQ